MRGLPSLAPALIASAALAGCGTSVTVTTAAAPGQIVAVGAENEYASVISQVGGRYVAVTAIENNPNVDPHSFEASPSVAEVVSNARLVVQNGLGYDTYMDKIEAASSNSSRKVIDVQKLLRLPDSTRNPHLWYSVRTMPAVAAAIAADLSKLQPGHGAYFAANAQRFDASLEPWLVALKRLRSRYPHIAVATTEPVGDYLLQAAGTRNLTPWDLEADVMNGIDPAPQAVTIERGLFSNHRVKVFLYNQQVADSVTQTFLGDAKAAGIPVVGVYETMPSHGYDYQSWMLAETRALERAIADGISTRRLR